MINSKRTITCDLTGLSYTEERAGAGFPGWGQMQGMVVKNEKGETIDDPCLCPEIMQKVSNYICELKNEIDLK